MNFDIPQLSGDTHEPRYRALARHLGSIARSLEPHTRLPSIRKLAQEAGVNPSTVVAALELLESDGVIYRREGSGTYVSPAKTHGPASLSPAIPTITYQVDFTASTPSPDYFPIEDFKQAFNAVLDRDRGHAFSYPEPMGYLPLRLSIADYLQNLGLSASPDLVQITSGAQQAISLLTQTLISPGDTVCIESPTYPGAIQALHASGAKLVPVSLGPHGPSRKDLAQAVKAQPKFFYAVPNFHNPTGICYSKESRQALIDLARNQDFYILEDDNVSELYYSGIRPKSLWQEAPDRVLYVKSFSKLFMPGLRLGFMILPEQLLASVTQAKQTADLGSPGINQRVLDMYMRSGRWQHYHEFLRQTYKERAQVLYQALNRHLGNVASYAPMRGGMNAWLTFPPAVKAQRLAELCATRGALVSPGTLYSLPGYDFSHSIRLSLASTFPDRIEEGVRILANCAEQLL